jgi:hypothetical protein
MSDVETPVCPHCCTPYERGQDLCVHCREPVGDHAVLWYDTVAGRAHPRVWARRGLAALLLLFLALALLWSLLESVT